MHTFDLCQMSTTPMHFSQCFANEPHRRYQNGTSL
jgi:hypothetical protein